MGSFTSSITTTSVLLASSPSTEKNQMMNQSGSASTAQAVESRGIRIATSIPRQHWMQSEKLEWLDKAIAANPCDLFLTSQEFFGGGSCREINRQKGVVTDDVPVSVDWITSKIGALAQKHNVHIGLGATVDHD